MDVNQNLNKRIDYLIELASKTLSTRYSAGGSFSREFVNRELFEEFETSAKSFILNLYEENHPYYTSFCNSCSTAKPSDTERGRGILKSIKTEIENNWLVKIKKLVSAEIFSDFLEMSEYFLDEGYKDPAAVMLGSVLEENLRQIADKNSISITFINSQGETKPKKADTINADICKAGIYSKLDQKQVTAWLDLRNKAAHGEYNKYDSSQVKLMHNGILDFITRIN